MSFRVAQRRTHLREIDEARRLSHIPALTGWFRPVHCRPLPAQATRAPLAARELVPSKRHDKEMSPARHPAWLWAEGWRETTRTVAVCVHELVAGHPTQLAVAEALPVARAALGKQLSKLEMRVRSLARDDRRVRRLMSLAGVGAIVVLTFVAAIDNPARFRSSKAVGRILA
jgi:transposase